MDIHISKMSSLCCVVSFTDGSLYCCFVCISLESDVNLAQSVGTCDAARLLLKDDTFVSEHLILPRCVGSSEVYDR